MQDYTLPPVPPPARQGHSPQFPWLVLMLILLLAAWGLPSIAGRVVAPFVEQWHYAATRGRERAEVESARGSLSEHNLESISRAFADIAKVVGPSVVHIDTVQTVEGPRDEFSQLFGPREYEAQGQGTGVIVDSDGYIITNHHVVGGAEAIEVKLSDGRSMPAQVVGQDAAVDLAVLKIQAEGLIAAEWGDSANLPVGSLVWAVGNPLGLDRSITFGIISAKGRHGIGSGLYQDYLQTDAVLNPGNSGGPLVDVHAKIIGINAAIATNNGRYQGIGFAIPSEMAHETYDQLKANGTVVRGFLGVVLDDVSPENAKKLGLKDSNGAIVKGIRPGSPADKAGFKVNDYVIAWNKQPVPNSIALRLMVARTAVNSHATAVVIRDGKEVTLDVLVQEREPDQPQRRR